MAQDRFDTIVGTNVQIKGNLSNQGSIEIFGSVDGEIQSDEDILIGQSAKISGPVKAKNIDISGQVIGAIEAQEKLELQPSSNIQGDISAAVLSIKPGAVFNGSCSVASDQAVSEKATKTKPELEID